MSHGVEARGVAPGHDEKPSIDEPARLDPAVVRRLSVLVPWLSTAHIALEWSLILGAAWLSTRFFHPLLYLLAVAFIAARQHALIVMAHEAAHYRLYRSKALNDWVAELALAWPFVFFSMQSYRRNHFPHHRHTNTPDDPDWVRKQGPDWSFPKRPGELAYLLLLDVTGIGFLKFLRVASKFPPAQPEGDPERRRSFARGRLLFLAGLVTALTLLGLWKLFLLYWVVPYVTWMQVIFHVRSLAEHTAIRGRTGVFAETRSVRIGWWERMFVVPKNVNFHLEHHLYPSVPFYRQAELHRLLMELPSYRSSLQLSNGYWGVLRECTTLPEQAAGRAEETVGQPHQA
jgi:fatty acid desaturase